VLIMNGTGIGAGIVIGGALYRGARQAAGEIGYLMPGKEFLNHDYPDFGPLETVVAESGIVSRARRELAGVLSPEKLECLSAEDVFDAYRRGEEWAKRIVEDIVDYLAIAIATVSTFFDPEMIILSGGVVRSADLLIEPIIKRITGKIPFVPPLVSSTLGPRGVVMGAVINLLHNTSDFYVVRKLS
jgi:predicted NBD/HSP70 family sugar kinase